MNIPILSKSLSVLAMSLLAVTLIVSCASSPTQESTGQFVDDSAITTKVKTKLLDDPMVSGLDISVETYKGIVQLSGFVNSESEKKQAEVISEGTDGVRSVKNDIHVK